MNYDVQITRTLESFSTGKWQGVVYRHMFTSRNPADGNRKGARWNPPEVRAIYCTLDRATAIAEGDYVATSQILPPDFERLIYRINVQLERVIDLSSWTDLARLRLQKDSFVNFDFGLTQEIGGAVERLGCDGMIVPSARHAGTNLVIFPSQTALRDYFRLIDCESLSQ